MLVICRQQYSPSVPGIGFVQNKLSALRSTVCPRGLAPFDVVRCYLKGAKTSGHTVAVWIRQDSRQNGGNSGLLF